MLSFIAGLVIFLLVFISKYALSTVMLRKKQVALSLAVIVLSELFIILLLYISIDKYELSGIRIIIGFFGAAVFCSLVYGLKSLTKLGESGKDGNI